MKVIKYWVCLLTILLGVTGCSDDGLDSKNSKAWVKAINAENCAPESIKDVIEEYGKDVGGRLGDACFMRTATPSFAFYSPKSMTVRRIVIDKEHCTDELLKEIEGGEGAEMVVLACKNVGQTVGVKSSGKEW
ncbi:MAG: hypothetical protein KZQ97_13835 [Candidatus Thiodiazotropha sp. (ex Dulcina madagascariensis)]|nr:hypothetical protein [Candidatus Thiodiazotropha sp. (ex Dulcina madagascariensis)]